MSSNRKIAKNTGFLYIRMLLIMGASLYTSRIVLNAIGVSDYGIYNIVGGIVAMFGFINGAMASATQRYLSYDIGLHDTVRLKKTFSAALTVHLIIASFIFLLGETLGLWYINYKLIYPVERTFAVNVVYQFSLFTMFLSVIQVPYNALILARERMNIYAYLSVFEVGLKLFISFIVLYWGSDKLITYAILIFCVAGIVRIAYQNYCRKHFEESHYKFEYDWSYLKELILYSGWNLFGNLSLVAKNQGVNLTLNLFFGTMINAAYGVAMQVQAAVTQFVSNFQSALNPQIIQNYAADNRDRSRDLIFLGARFSFFVMQFMAVPVIVNTSLILQLWLGSNVPEYSAVFLKISLIALLIDCISGPMATGVLAVGKIKQYQLWIGSLNLLVPFVVYIFLKIGNPPEVAFMILVCFSICSLLFRLYFLKKFYEFNFQLFFSKVLFQILLISFSAYLITLLLRNIVVVDSFFKLCLWTFLFIVAQIVIILFVGITKSQRRSMVVFLRKKMKI